MKTKFIWTAMCLPLAFAACTNEEVFVEDNLAVLEGKKAVELKVAATYGNEGAESRMVNNSGTFLWDNTDVLGAVWNNASGIFSNNRFTNSLTQADAQADFTTQATTVEGSYVFYYPYNTDVTKDLTSGIVYSLPEPQEYDPTGEKMMNNNFMISPNVIVDGNEPGELTLPLTLRSIYAYGKLNIKLPEVFVLNSTNVNSVNIQKIIIKYSNSNVHKAGKINITNVPVVDLSAETIEDLIAGEYSGDVYDETDDAELIASCEGKTKAEVRAILFAAADKTLTAQNSDYAEGEVLALTEGDEISKQVSIACVSDEYPDGVTLTKNDVFSTRVLLPAADDRIDDEDVTVSVDVYTDKGVFSVLTNKKAKIKAGHTADLADLDRGGVANAFVLNANQWVETPAAVAAISEADFIASIKTFSNTTVNVELGAFPLTPAAIKAIPSNVKVNFISNVTFEGDMTLKNMVISGEYANLRSGEIVLSDDVTAGEIYVNNGANVTVASSTVSLGNLWVQSGKLTIDAVDNQGKSAGITLNSEKNIILVKRLEDTERELVINSELTGKVVVHDGKVIINANVDELSVGGEGIVENNAVLKVESNDGVIDNYGTLIVNDQNNGVLNQKSEDAKLTLGQNNNGGVINTAAYSETTVTGENMGEIIFAANARVSANGNVTYQAPADIKATDFSQLPTAITKIEFAGDFTYSYGTNENALATLQSKVKTLVFKGNLTLGKDWNLNSGSAIQFIGAKANITGGKILSNVATILAGVADDASTETVDESVATKVYVGTNTTIKTVETVTLSGEAAVWNDGNVYGTAEVASAWGGNAIAEEPETNE